MFRLAFVVMVGEHAFVLVGLQRPPGPRRWDMALSVSMYVAGPERR